MSTIEEKLEAQGEANGMAARKRPMAMLKHLERRVGCQPVNLNKPPQTVKVRVMNTYTEVWEALKPFKRQETLYEMVGTHE